MAVPTVPRKPLNQSLIMSPTLPPNGKEFSGNMNARVTEAINNPKVTYLRFLQMENTFLSNKRLIPTTKKNVHKKREIRRERVPMIFQVRSSLASFFRSTFSSLSFLKLADADFFLEDAIGL